MSRPNLWDCTGVTTGDGLRGRWDFFVSYTQADRAWAEWIAWTLARTSTLNNLAPSQAGCRSCPG